MDIFIPIVIFFVLFVFFSLCGMCCRRRRDQGAVIATPVVITSTQHHVGPYPVHVNTSTTAAPAGVVMQQHSTGTGVYPMQQPGPQAMPQPMPQPMPGYNPTPGGYPPQPYPPQQQNAPMQQMPMPMPMPGTAPPLHTVHAQATMNPPSYDSVVTENYAKQAPYNPHFTGQ